MTAMIDEQSTHCLRAERKPVSAPFPFTPAVVLKPQPRLMDQRCWLQGVIPPFAAEVSAGDVTQFAVDHRKKRVWRSGILAGHLCLLQSSVGG